MSRIPFLCLAIVLLMPYVLATYGAYYRKKSFGMLDNANPRAQAAQLDAYGARIYAAQQNAWEAATLFSASVLAATVTSVKSRSHTCAMRAVRGFPRSASDRLREGLVDAPLLGFHSRPRVLRVSAGERCDQRIVRINKSLPGEFPFFKGVPG